MARGNPPQKRGPAPEKTPRWSAARRPRLDERRGTNCDGRALRRSAPLALAGEKRENRRSPRRFKNRGGETRAKIANFWLTPVVFAVRKKS